MSAERTVYAGLLAVATFGAVISAVLLLAAPYEGDEGAAWFWGAWFLAASVVAAWCFGELL